jgi:hypothetical protein
MSLNTSITGEGVPAFGEPDSGLDDSSLRKWLIHFLWIFH